MIFGALVQRVAHFQDCLAQSTNSPHKVTPERRSNSASPPRDALRPTWPESTAWHDLSRNVVTLAFFSPCQLTVNLRNHSDVGEWRTQRRKVIKLVRHLLIPICPMILFPLGVTSIHVVAQSPLGRGVLAH